MCHPFGGINVAGILVTTEENRQSLQKKNKKMTYCGIRSGTASTTRWYGNPWDIVIRYKYSELVHDVLRLVVVVVMVLGRGNK